MNPIHRYKGDGSYSEIKRISEEVRAVAVELGIPIVSAVQTIEVELVLLKLI